MIGSISSQSFSPTKGATKRGPQADPQTPQDSAVLADPLQFKLPAHKGFVAGHLASDPQHARYESTQYPLRTYMVTGDNQVAAVDFRQVFDQSRLPAYPSKSYKINSKELDKVVEQAVERRQQQLGDLDNLIRVPRATPKDSSLNPTTVTLFTRSFSEVSGVYAQQLAQVGQVEGFHISLASDPASVKRLSKEAKEAQIENMSFLSIPQGEVWVEDYGEPLLQKGWTTPAIFEGDWLSTAIADDRQKRMKGDTTFSEQGQVHESQLQYASLAKAGAQDGIAHQALSYLEGGNIFLGSRVNGEAYALIGRDSLAITRELLTRESGGVISDEKLLEVVAADLGVPVEGVFPVEQPGEFHLDMRMMPIAPGEYALNDAKAAAEQQIVWLQKQLDESLTDKTLSKAEVQDLKADFKERSKSLRAEAKARAVFEVLARKDLEAAGMKVHSLAGVFVDPDEATKDTSNFFNARHGVNEQGERFSVFMGGTPEEEAYVAEKLLKGSDAQISRLHFLDPTQTEETLSLFGGLKCRTKPDGDLVARQDLGNPAIGRLSA